MTALDILAFGAHPDDVELGCGGTLLLARDLGMRTGVVDLTAGERGSRGTRETRAAEAAKASAMMGLAVRETLAFADTELTPSLVMRRAIIEAIRRHRPRIVLAPFERDVHPDHHAAGRAVRDAWYPSGMKNVDASGDAFRPDRLLHYFMHEEADTPLVVDVTRVWDERIALVRCFESQLHGDPAGHPTLISRPDFVARLEARARVWGRRAGVEFAEPFVVGAAGAVPLTDLRAILG